LVMTVLRRPTGIRTHLSRSLMISIVDGMALYNGEKGVFNQFL
jgi:hypothetical protein